MFHGNFYIKLHSRIWEIHAYTRIYSIFAVCLCHNYHQNDHYIEWKKSLNSAVTLTSKFQGQMINCLCLKNAWSHLQGTKAMWINWLSCFIYDLGHWPCLWPWPWITKVKSLNCHIYEISDLIAKNEIKEFAFFRWFDLRFAFIICCSAVQVTSLSLGTSVW